MAERKDKEADALARLRSYYPAMRGFRPGQWRAITAALRGKDSLVLMPTGAGKSLCFQAVPLLTRQLVVVVSPLLSLQEDQVSALQARGVRARSLSSAHTPAENKQTLALLRDEASPPLLDLLYVSPEAIVSSKLLHALCGLAKRGGLALIAVDEAHCCSTWGHDFRPTYARFGREVREALPAGTPMMALTATATAEVARDLSEKLCLLSPTTVRVGMDRPEIRYEVVLSDALPRPALDDLLRRLHGPHAGQSGLIYCATRETCESLADTLSKSGLSAAPYHAGMSTAARHAAQKAWRNDETRIVCATVAFGMGVDKRDVRFVVHWSVPLSFEAYAQESGRAARDGEAAVATIYYSEDAARLARWMLNKTAPNVVLERRLAALDAVVAHCRAGAGCRRRRLLEHFGEASPPEQPAGRRETACCDACARPDLVAAAVGRLVLSESASAGLTGGDEDEAKAARGGRKRARSDPHDTGLVDSEDEGHAEAIAESDNGIARAGGGWGGGFVPAAKGRGKAAGGKVSAAQLGARLTRLEEAEEDDEEESGASASARWRARLALAS